MNDNIDRLIERQGRAYTEAQALLDRAGTDNPLSAEEEATLRALSDEIVSLGEQVDSGRQIERSARQGDKSAEVISDLQGMSRTGEYSDPEPQPTLRSLKPGESLKLRGDVVRTWNEAISQGHTAGELIERAVATGNGTPRIGAAGGLLVPTDLESTFYHVLLNVSGVRTAGAMTVTTAGGQPIEFPKGTDIGTTPRTASATTMEAGTIAEGSPTFDVVVTNPVKYAGLTLISREAYEDMAVDIESFVGRQLARKIGWDQDYDFTLGAGSSGPKGIMNAPATSQRVTVTRAAPTYDNVVDVKFGIGNYPLESPCWMVTKSGLAALWKVKGSDGQPILANPAFNMGGMNNMSIFGDPIKLNNHMQEFGGSAAGRFPIVYGDFSQGYIIRDVGSVEITRSIEADFKTDQVTYRAILRSDGRILNEQLFSYGITN